MDISDSHLIQTTKTSSNSVNYDFTLMIIPGNGGGDIKYGNFYYWLYKKLKSQYPKANIICENMPDPNLAREVFWIPFIKSKIQQAQNENKRVYIVGHSSGAVALMRLMEHTRITGGFIVAGCISHLNDETELLSGYYPKQPDSKEERPWLWEKMKQNSEFIINLGSVDDCFIPINEIREITNMLGLVKGKSYYEFPKGYSHFMTNEFPELYNIINESIYNNFNEVN